MKITFPLFICLWLTALQGKAQTIRFTDTTNIWRCSKTLAPDGYPIQGSANFVTGDTLMSYGGKQYAVIRAVYGKEIWVREDTAARKVHLQPTETWLSVYKITDTSEFVYMDFSLQPGDSMMMPLVNTNSADNRSIHIVTDRDSVMIGTQWHTRLRIRTINLGFEYYDYYEITEGIGPFSGPFLETAQTGEWGPYNISCFSNKGIIPTPPFGENCFTSIGHRELPAQNRFILAPNPASGKVSIRSTIADRKEYRLLVSDITGKVVLSHSFTDRSDIDISSLVPGLYITKIVQEGVLIYVNKILVTHP